jgi:hypothetical protein
MLLSMLLIAVPVSFALAVLIELVDNRRERIDAGIADAHPVFARPTPDVASGAEAVARLPVRRAATGLARPRAGRTARGATRPERRRVPHLH